MDVKFNGFVEVRYIDDRVRAGGVIFGRRQVAYTARFSPARRIGQISVDGRIGEEVDFANARQGRGVTLNVNANVNATDHLELSFLQNDRWLNVDTLDSAGRLFNARVSRLRGTYNFTARAYARVIGQYVSTTRDAGLFTFAVAPRTATFSSSVLFAYKLNWQSVLFAGYGDNRELSELEALEPASRQFFVKISYAIQR
jgi:hypothetical protein